MPRASPFAKAFIASLLLTSPPGAILGIAASSSSTAAQRAIAESVSAALQGNSRRSREALNAVPAEQFSGEDADYRACMLERFGGTSPPPSVEDVDDPFVRETLAIYQDYWWRALTAPAKREVLNAKLQRRLSALLEEQAVAWNWDALEKRLADRMRERGYYSQLGHTPPLRELMIWRKQDSKIHDVALPEGPHQVRVEMLDDFVALGWSAYARCDRGSNGGWVGDDRIYAVMPAFADDLDGDAFRASLLGHEAQHFADGARFPGLEAWELEYRAKLTELWMARQSLPKLLTRLAGSQSDDKQSPHTFANKRVLNDLRTRLQAQGITPSQADLSDVPADALHKAAREQLLEDSEERQAAVRNAPEKPR
ncbi:MAG: hypothetical protein ACREV5_18910 [Steroidobacter sp.]